MSDTNGLTFDQAQPDELATVLGILDDAAAWLGRQHIKQWPPQFSGVKDWRSERIEGYVAAGQTWLVRNHGTPVATFTLSEKSDPDFADGWPDGPDDALYIFRMAVLRSSAGRQIGTRILNWASARAKDESMRWLRLDCHRRNLALQHYYERHGFERVGTLIRVVQTPDDGQPFTRNSGALYQRTAGTVIFPDQDRQADDMTDRYDPTGEAAVWAAASDLVITLRRDDDAAETAAWNAAIEQAARVLDSESRAIRQRDGMYFRVISGQRNQTGT